MGWAIGVGTILSGLAATGGAVMQMQAARSQAKFQARQARDAARDQRIAADQAEAQRREELTASLSSVGALWGARGVDGGSPGALAITRAATADASSSILTERYNLHQGARQSELEARYARARAQNALWSGVIGAAGGLGQVGSGVGDLSSRGYL